jgi:hypothetical protein
MKDESSRSPARRIVRWAVLGVVVILAGIQLIPADRTWR